MITFKEFLAEEESDGFSGKTSEEADHFHFYEMGKDGNGRTLKTIGEHPDHTHDIEESIIMTSDSHSHTIEIKNKDTVGPGEK